MSGRAEPAPGRGRRRDEGGQASLELLALLPLLLFVAVGAAQVLAIGYAGVLAGNAAEAGALALAGGRDPEAAVASLPGWARSRAHIAVTGGVVRVSMRPPALLSPLTGKLLVHAVAAVELP
jgi:pilus assembly protein CpaE